MVLPTFREDEHAKQQREKIAGGKKKERKGGQTDLEQVRSPGPPPSSALYLSCLLVRPLPLILCLLERLFETISQNVLVLKQHTTEGTHKHDRSFVRDYQDLEIFRRHVLRST